MRPGNYELELGTPMRELIYEHAGGIADGRKLKAVIPGGSSVPALSPDQIDVPLDYDSLAELKTFFGAASLIVVDDRCCMVQLALRSTQFYMHESCGKCTPCREGTRWMVQILEKIERGDGELSDLELLESINGRILGKVLCALGEFAVYPVSSYIAQVARRVRRPHPAGPLPVRRQLVDRGDPRAVRAAPRPGPRREAAGGDRVSTNGKQPELVTITVDDVEIQVPKGIGLVEAALARRDRDPGLLLRAAARAAGRRLPHVPLRGRSPGRRSRRPPAR